MRHNNHSNIAFPLLLIVIQRKEIKRQSSCKRSLALFRLLEYLEYMTAQNRTQRYLGQHTKDAK